MSNQPLPRELSLELAGRDFRAGDLVGFTWHASRAWDSVNEWSADGRPFPLWLHPAGGVQPVLIACVRLRPQGSVARALWESAVEKALVCWLARPARWRTG